jgi:hypothetical protein
MLVAAALLMGCPTGTDSTGNDNPSADPLPEFSVSDVNPNSTRFNQAISPRDYLGEVSAWYFGHAT